MKFFCHIFSVLYNGFNNLITQPVDCYMVYEVFCHICSILYNGFDNLITQPIDYYMMYEVFFVIFFQFFTRVLECIPKKKNK